jgi:hypothetical protein
MTRHTAASFERVAPLARFGVCKAFLRVSLCGPGAGSHARTPPLERGVHGGWTVPGPEVDTSARCHPRKSAQFAALSLDGPALCAKPRTSSDWSRRCARDGRRTDFFDGGGTARSPAGGRTPGVHRRDPRATLDGALDVAGGLVALPVEPRRSTQSCARGVGETRAAVSYWSTQGECTGPANAAVRPLIRILRTLGGFRFSSPG